MRNFWIKVKEWGKENAPVLLYFLIAVLIEMTAVFVVEGTPFLSRPFLSIGLLLFICGILFLVKSNRVRTIACAGLLAVQTLLDIVFSVIFALTDQYFDFGMLQLRNDAFAILESIPIDFITFYVGLFFCISFIVFGMRFSHEKKKVKTGKRSVFFHIGLMAAGLATLATSFVTYYPRTAKDKYDEMVDGREHSAYSAYGMIGNLLGETGNALFQTVEPIAGEEIDEFIYASVSEPTEMFGVAKDKNVVTILAESFEWYTFLRGLDGDGCLQGEYPNALAIPEEELALIFPNLTEYYNESVLMTNFHGREKTDISETLSVMGNYPTDAYVNYEYAENTLPHTLPNILKAQEEGEIYLRSFHNGFKSFYNREQAHPMFGFEQGTPIDMYDMEEMSNALEAEGTLEIFHNYMDEGIRNLDSEMVTTAKHLMFPTDQRFYTYITTITMHGMYYDRMNLRPEELRRTGKPTVADRIEMLSKYKPTDTESPYFKYAERLYYYMTTGVEFDFMLGCMKEDLQEKGLWDNTIIVIFGDHNAYYQEMSNYVKGISDYEGEEKFTDLYNVPLLIRDKDLLARLGEENRVVDKFVCTADIVPTLFDLLGIKYFDNMYYGHSVFAEEQSVLYSRAYDVFIGDGIVRRSVKGDFYLYDGLTEDGKKVKSTLASFEKEGLRLVEKIKYCDYVFRQDHFGKKENYDRFQAEMKKING